MLMPQLYPDRMRSLQLISSRRRMDRQIYFPSTGWWLPPPFSQVSVHRDGKEAVGTRDRRADGKVRRERRLRSNPWPNWTAANKGGQRRRGERRNLHSSRWQVFSQLKPVLLIMFDISLITFIYITSAPSRRLDCISIQHRQRSGYWLSYKALLHYK